MALASSKANREKTPVELAHRVGSAENTITGGAAGEEGVHRPGLGTERNFDQQFSAKCAQEIPPAATPVQSRVDCMQRQREEIANSHKKLTIFSSRTRRVRLQVITYVIFHEVGAKSFSKKSCKIVLLSAIFQVEMESVLPDGGFDDW